MKRITFQSINHSIPKTDSLFSWQSSSLSCTKKWKHSVLQRSLENRSCLLYDKTQNFTYLSKWEQPPAFSPRRQFHHRISVFRNEEPFSSIPRQETTKNSSFEHSSFGDPREAILDAALLNVTKYGWTIEAISAGAESLGYPGVAHGMFPDGALELIEYFLRKSDKEMVNILQSIPLQSMNTRERIKTIVKTRLEMIKPYIHVWPQALATLASPLNLSRSLNQFGVMIDEMWYQAGDKSTDVNWYTKRAMLSGIYSATELYMLTDKSADYKSTWEFLDRRVEDIVQLTTLGTEAHRIATTLGNGIFSLFSSGLNTVASQVLPAVSNFSGHFNQASTTSPPIHKEGSIITPEVNPSTIQPAGTIPLSVSQKPFSPTPILK